MHDDNIHIFKLVNGEFCIGDITLDAESFVEVRNLRTLIAHPQGVQIAPFMFCNPVVLDLHREHIIAITPDVEKGLCDFYRQNVSGIVLPVARPLKVVQ